MRPLLAIALGLVVVGLYAKAGSVDLLVDPVGWLLVLVGVRVLADRVDLGFRPWLWLLGGSALVASGVLTVPAARAWLEDADPALGWAVDLPALAFCGLLCHALAGLATAAGRTGAAAWAEWTAIGFAVTALAPVVVIGGDLDGLRDPAGLVTGVAQLSLFLLCLACSGRAWAGAPQVAGSSRDAAE